jgi:hypothetical protein
MADFGPFGAGRDGGAVEPVRKSSQRVGQSGKIGRVISVEPEAAHRVAKPIAWAAASVSIVLAVLSALFVAQWLFVVLLIEGTSWGLNQMADSAIFIAPSKLDMANQILRNVVLPASAFAAAVVGARWALLGERSRAWAAVAVGAVFAATVFL